MTKKSTPATKTPTSAVAGTSAATASAAAEDAAVGTQIANSHYEVAKIDTLVATGDVGEGIVSAGNIPPAPVLIHPTVGRKVWYRPGPQDRHSHMQWIDGEPLDATILAVHGDRCINAQVLDINGTAFVRRSWPLVQPGDEAPDGSYFEWMPYQTGQAAKAA